MTPPSASSSMLLANSNTASPAAAAAAAAAAADNLSSRGPSLLSRKEATRTEPGWKWLEYSWAKNVIQSTPITHTFTFLKLRFCMVGTNAG